MQADGIYFDDLAIGQSAEMWRTVDEGDIRAFAAVSGDDNPLHLDEAFAAAGPFRSPVAHGLLAASYISALIGAKLPGPGAIYVSQTLQFRRPVRPGDEVHARVAISALDAKTKHVTLACVCSVRGKTVLEGEAVALAPRRR